MANEENAQGSLLTGNLGSQEVSGGAGSAPTGQTEQTKDTAPSAQSESSKERPKWIAQLPEEYRKDTKADRFKSIGEVWKAYGELEGKLGKAVFVPGENATDEEKAAYRKSIGVPESPEGYKIKGLPESTAKEFAAFAHSKGIPAQHAETILEFYDGMAQKQAAAENARAKTTVEALKTELGESFKPDTERMLSFVKKTFSAESMKALDRVGNDPHLIKDLIALSKRFSEDSLDRGTAPDKNEDPMKKMYPSMFK